MPSPRKAWVIDLCCFPASITDKTERPTLDHLADHLDYIVQLAGIDRSSLGTDFYEASGYQKSVHLGVWDPAEYPAPPWHFPLDGGTTIEFVETMSRRGYDADDIRKVLGGNFARVFSQAWH